LPDCYASRVSGPLIRIEKVVIMVEKAAGIDADSEIKLTDLSLSDLDLVEHAEAAGVDQELFDSTLDIRWLKRRVEYVHEILVIMIFLFPEYFSGCIPTLSAFRSRLAQNSISQDFILVQLRMLSIDRIHTIPFPMGFQPKGIIVDHRKTRCLQEPALDPP